MGLLRVVQPGMLSTVQDLGRDGYSALGVAAGGALDTLSLRVGNRLVGNPDGAAALEMTLIGATLRFEGNAIVALSGGETSASIESSGAPPRPVPALTATSVSAGETLRTGPILRGVRTYLCIAGGLNVPAVFGAASTNLAAGFGGYQGRAIRADDVLECGARASVRPAPADPGAVRALVGRILELRSVRCVRGVHGDWFDQTAIRRFWDSPFTVSSQSDRAGVRLDGTTIASRAGTPGGRMISEGMPNGAIQMPEGGQPIVLLADRPTTGGYPVIACVATVDLPILGQLRPRDTIRFQQVSLDEARTLFRDHDRRLDAAIPPP